MNVYIYIHIPQVRPGRGMRPHNRRYQARRRRGGAVERAGADARGPLRCRAGTRQGNRGEDSFGLTLYVFIYMYVYMHIHIYAENR